MSDRRHRSRPGIGRKNAKSGSLQLRIAARLALPLTLLTQPSGGTAQDATLYVNAPVEGLAVSGSRLFWKAGCGYRFSSYIRSVEATIFTGGGHAFGGGLLGQTLFETPNGCGTGPDAVASRNVAVDDTHVYYIDRSRRLMRVGRSSETAREAPVRLADVEAATHPGYTLAASPGWIAWTNGSTIVRIATSGSTGFRIEAIVDPEELPAIHDLIPMGDDYVVRAGPRLYRVTPPPRFRLEPLAETENLLAFAVSGTDIYFAVREGANYIIGVIGSDGAFREIFRQNAHPNEQVDQIAVADGRVFWHLVINGGAGPILTAPSTGDGWPIAITDNIRLSSASRLSVSAGWLMWTRLEDGRLYRLPTSACDRLRGCASGG